MEKTRAQSRVPVTALIAWPRFHSARAEPQGAKQIAAPAETRTPNVHRAKRIAPRECEWKHGDSGNSAGREKPCPTKRQKNPLDSDRPSHGRRLHSLTPSRRINRDSAPCYMIGPKSSQIVWTPEGFHPWSDVEQSPDGGHDDVAGQKPCPPHAFQKRGHLLPFYSASLVRQLL
jgi:hypothetical protein